jgi:hypothetical protein
MLDTFHDWFRSLHILVGAFSLIVFWIPVVTPKGGKLHRAAGRWFVRSIYVVAGSGLVACVWALGSPATFLNDANPSAALVENVRFFYAILALLAVMALHGAILGTRAVQTKNHHESLRSRPLTSIMILQLIGSLALATGAVAALWSTGLQSRYFVMLAVAMIGLLDYWEQRKYVTRPQPPGAWFDKHVECMLGCGIAIYTAASVTFFARVVELHLSGPLALVPWLLPAAIGIPATYLTKRHFRR